MKAASADLINLLATRQFGYAGLYHFALVGGGNLRYTSADTDVLFDGNTYSAGGTTGPYLERDGKRAKVRWKVGLEVDTMEFDVIPGSGTVNGQSFSKAVRLGVFDGAELTFSHAYWPNSAAWATPIVPTGAIVMFVGRVAPVQAGRSLVKVTAHGHTELLDQPLPRNLYQAGCVNTLYDSSCALVKASFGVNGTAATGSTPSTINNTLAEATGYFDMGSITFTSGANSGLSRTVKSYTQGSPGTVTLISPFPVAPADGDTLTIYPGCDKTVANCALKFNNLARFRGFPHVPLNETAV